MVNIEVVSKFFNDKKVLDDISLNIRNGTITSFIDPNGPGTSTLISLISRLITQDGGEVTIDAKNIKKVKNNHLAKKISILKQSNSINLKLTIRELVSFGRFPYSQGRLTKEDWTKVDEAIAYMEFRDIQHKFIDELSVGLC